jgi:hypothetical protein
MQVIGIQSEGIGFVLARTPQSAPPLQSSAAHSVLSDKECCIVPGRDVNSYVLRGFRRAFQKSRSCLMAAGRQYRYVFVLLGEGARPFFGTRPTSHVLVRLSDRLVDPFVRPQESSKHVHVRINYSRSLQTYRQL